MSMSSPLDFKVLEEMYELMVKSSEPGPLFHDGSLTDGKCIGNVHVATGTGWCKCGKEREQ